MRRLLAVCALTALAAAPAALALDETGFRYTRPLAASGEAPVVFEPDGPLFAHARAGFADLRILDARGRQVPWRLRPEPELVVPTQVPLLNRGRQAGKAVALIDRGPDPSPIARIELQLPEKPFVGRVEVLGSDDRLTFTLLSTTAIYDLRGARPARSTVALLPPTDFRYLLLRASGVPSIDGATAAGRMRAAPTEIRTEPPVSVEQRGRRTVARLDLGFRNVPVDELSIRASTPRFDRPVEVAGSNDGRTFVPLGAGRIFRFGGGGETSIPLSAAHRFLRVTIDNGDDLALELLRVEVARRPRTVLVAENQPGPYRLLYGNSRLGSPDYDFAQLPRASLGLDRVAAVQPGPERRNPDYRPPKDTRSFFERNDWLVKAALALAAIVLGVAGYLALRRRV